MDVIYSRMFVANVLWFKPFWISSQANSKRFLPAPRVRIFVYYYTYFSVLSVTVVVRLVCDGRIIKRYRVSFDEMLHPSSRITCSFTPTESCRRTTTLNRTRYFGILAGVWTPRQRYVATDFFCYSRWTAPLYHALLPPGGKKTPNSIVGTYIIYTSPSKLLHRVLYSFSSKHT